ncbi:hypothetical protein [Neptuniibacter sp.]|uniref:hypothetical protein n=1 Tax=Neptuniibacter sp. TaxID=1962643 RepID=UPI00260D16D7|nr:hypothetical protein [Neptuniibacter sp.]MCP4595124.1 hypothetical protein [Neptuniibacter sp.]
MQQISKLIAWVVIIVLTATLAYFVMQLLSRDTNKGREFSPAPVTVAPPVPPVPIKEMPLVNEQPQGVQRFVIHGSGEEKTTNDTMQSSDAQQLERDQRELKKQIVQDLNRRLSKLSYEPGKVDTQELDSILQEMQKLQGKDGLVGGVNINALRETIRLSDEMQKLAVDIQSQAEKGEEADSALLLQQSKQMEGLQKELLKHGSPEQLVPGARE